MWRVSNVRERPVTIEVEDLAESDRGGHLIKSVGKAIDILYALYESHRPMRIRDLADRLRMTPSAVSRIVTTLAGGGLIEQDEGSGRYQLGFGLALLGNASVGRRELDRIALPVMAEISARFREYISLARLYRGKVVMIRSKTMDSLQRDYALLSVLPLHASASGKLFAAWLGATEFDALVTARGMDPYTARTITSIAAFKEEVDRIRHCGFAIDNEELIHGLRHAATPIRDHSGRVVAALSAGGLSRKVHGEHLASLIRAIASGSLEISRQLGYVGAMPLDLDVALPTLD